eukprot:TRINITY_DN7677_c0_g1_i1.p1 TRINITY_DN7677_c0_g1~~TRINITY_DN7677_c0_g1_i1.p1  ORF type:complete len:432 (-),score=60.04 TRINITY_DN7677_c0_g1_i1:32-1327(-)
MTKPLLLRQLDRKKPQIIHDISNTFGRIINTEDAPVLSDIIFQVDDVYFYGCRGIIAARSVYFTTMFTNRMKESVQGKIVIEGVKSDIFWLVLQWICCSHLPGDNLEAETALSLYKYADSILLTSLKTHIVDILRFNANKYIEVSQCLPLLTLWDICTRSHMISIDEVHPQAKEMIYRYAPFSMLGPVFYDICLETLRALMCDDMCPLDEWVVCSRVCHWFIHSPIVQSLEPDVYEPPAKRFRTSETEKPESKHNREQKEILNEILSWVRWEHMDCNRIYDAFERFKDNEIISSDLLLELFPAARLAAKGSPFTLFGVTYEKARPIRGLLKYPREVHRSIGKSVSSARFLMCFQYSKPIPIRVTSFLTCRFCVQMIYAEDKEEVSFVISSSFDHSFNIGVFTQCNFREKCLLEEVQSQSIHGGCAVGEDSG